MFESAKVATLVLSFLAGMGTTAIMFWSPKKGGGKVLKGLVVALTILFFFYGGKNLLSLFGLFGTGDGFMLFFLLDMAVFFLNIVVGTIISNKKDVNRMKDNVVLRQTVERAKALHATAIYVCADGAYLVYDQDPWDKGDEYTTVKVRTKDEYDNYVAPAKSFAQIAVRDRSKIEAVLYRSYDFPNMDHSQRSTFASAFCKTVKGYTALTGGIMLEYFRPGSIAATGLTETSSGYTVKYSESKDFTFTRKIATYHVIVANDVLKKKAAPSPEPQNQMNQW